MKTTLTIITLLVGGLIGWLLAAHRYNADNSIAGIELTPEMQQYLKSPGFKALAEVSQEFAAQMSKEEVYNYIRDVTNMVSRINQQNEAVIVQEGVFAVLIHRAMKENGSNGVHELLSQKIDELTREVNEGRFDGTELEKMAKAVSEVGIKEIGSPTCASSGTPEAGRP